MRGVSEAELKLGLITTGILQHDFEAGLLRPGRCSRDCRRAHPAIAADVGDDAVPAMERRGAQVAVGGARRPVLEGEGARNRSDRLS
jgi:hypothetical protein